MIFESDFGINLVLGEAPARVTTQEPATVDIYLGYADDAYGSGRLIGTVAPGETLVVEHNPDFDRHLRVYPISHAINGVPDVSDIREAVSKFVPIQRETATPEIGQVGAGSTFNDGGTVYARIIVGGRGFGRHARLMKVEVADDPDFEVNLETTVYDSAEFLSRRLPNVINVKREATTAQVRYVRVSYSAGTEFGPTSNVTEVTFPAHDGSGGSTGDFEPIDRVDLEINML